MATASSRDVVELLARVPVFSTLVRTDLERIAARLVIALGRRLRETNERLTRQSFQTVQSRVAVVLSQLVQQALAEGVDGDVMVTATQADLAQLAGSSRESASRFLAVLERAGVISQGRGRLVVHHPDALKQYVF